MKPTANPPSAAATPVAAVDEDFHLDADEGSPEGEPGIPQPPVPARVLAGLHATGATLALIWVLAPHSTKASDAGVLGCILAAYLSTTLLLVGARRLTARSLAPLLAVTVGAVISSAVYFSANPASGFALFYLWATFYAFYFFSLRQAIWLTALTAVSYTGALLAIGHGSLTSEDIAHLVLTEATAVISGALVRFLTQGFRRSLRQQAVAERALRARAHRYRLLFERNPQPMWVFDSETLAFLAVNEAAIERYGYSREEFLAMDIRRIRPPEDVDPLQRTLADAGVARQIGNNWRHVLKDGSVIEVEVVADDLPFDGRPARLVTAVDITARKNAERELIHRADHDDLTGLYNRRRFELEAQAAVGRALELDSTCSLLVLDLDHFKFVNDSFGHTVGDTLIDRVAAELVHGLEPGDIMARLGGDEFAILLPGSNGEKANRVASALLERLRLKVWQGLRPTTASIGVATLDRETCATAKDLLVAADIALYEAKDTGRNRYSVSSGTRGLTWVEEIRSALDSDRLVVHSQPILDLASGEIVQEELLVRMLDRDGQIIAPASFIPTAERFGLIQEIDRWVAQRGIELIKQGRRVEINISAHSIGDRQLTRMVADAVAGGADPELLVFEITETAAAANFAEVREFADRLGRLGCGFALDDFGTGFGSFSYLKHVPVRYLKIDMDFVRELPRNLADQRVVKAIVSIAGGLGQRTIAEGVEDQATLEMLRYYGVHYAQGYHVGRPAPLGPALARVSVGDLAAG